MLAKSLSAGVLVFLLAGCGLQAVPAQPITAAPPTPAKLEGLTTPELAPDDWGRVPVESRAYLLDVEPFTTPAYIAATPQMSVEGLEATLRRLEGMTAPAALAPAHELLLKGYRNLAEGRRLAVENVGDGEVQAEARSLTDFGQLKLREHVQLVSEYLLAQ